MKGLTANRILIVLCLLGFTLPMLFAHRESGRVSELENRYYADPPKLFDEEGHPNFAFPTDFDNWISDNLRLRSVIVSTNAKLQYALFGRIVRTEERANTEGELFFSDISHLDEFQGANRLTDEALSNYVLSLQRISDWCTSQGATMYYMQCFMKEHFYTDRYVPGVLRPAGETRSDQVVRGIIERTSVRQIPVHDVLEAHLDEKIYYQVTDPVHWNERGAWYGFAAMMDAMRQEYPELSPADAADYEIGKDNSFANIYGLIYPIAEDSDTFTLREVTSTEQDIASAEPELDAVLRYKEHDHLFTNTACGNDLKLLIIGDSYQRMYIKNQLAEKFAAVLSLDTVNMDRIDQIVRLWHPDIVVVECTECNGLDSMMQFVLEKAQNIE